MAASETTPRETQFLREACNQHGRVAGHNNRMVLALEIAGLIRRDHRGIAGQSNFLITDKGRLVLEDATP